MGKYDISKESESILVGTVTLYLRNKYLVQSQKKTVC